MSVNNLRRKPRKWDRRCITGKRKRNLGRFDIRNPLVCLFGRLTVFPQTEVLRENCASIRRHQAWAGCWEIRQEQQGQDARP